MKEFIKNFLKDNPGFLNPFSHIDIPKHALTANAKRTSFLSKMELCFSAIRGQRGEDSGQFMVKSRLGVYDYLTFCIPRLFMLFYESVGESRESVGESRESRESLQQKGKRWLAKFIYILMFPPASVLRIVDFFFPFAGTLLAIPLLLFAQGCAKLHVFLENRFNLYKLRRFHPKATLQDVDPLPLFAEFDEFPFLDFSVTSLCVEKDTDQETLTFFLVSNKQLMEVNLNNQKEALIRYKELLEELPIKPQKLTLSYKDNAGKLKLAAALSRNIVGILKLLEHTAASSPNLITEDDIDKLMNPTLL